MRSRACILSIAAVALSACAHGPYSASGVKPVISFPVTTNETPYSQCLSALGTIPATNLPVFAVGKIADKTGRVDRTNYSTVLSHGGIDTHR
jgi:holdfast attachment protein HfaB